LSAEEKLRKLPPDELRRIAAALSETWLPELPEGVSYRDALEFTARKLAELELSFDEAREALPYANPVLARELEEWAAEVRRLKEKARRRRAAADTDTA
jgi:hypothetical protein